MSYSPLLITRIDVAAATGTDTSTTMNIEYCLRGASDTGACALTLPAAASCGDGMIRVVRDEVGHAGSSLFTVTAGSGTTINGVASVTLASNWAVFVLEYRADRTMWRLT